MPLIKIVGIDNFGRTIMLGFALLHDGTSISYQWLFKKLKSVWEKEPGFIITDECKAMISGNFMRG